MHFPVFSDRGASARKKQHPRNLEILRISRFLWTGMLQLVKNSTTKPRNTAYFSLRLTRVPSGPGQVIKSKKKSGS